MGWLRGMEDRIEEGSIVLKNGFSAVGQLWSWASDWWDQRKWIQDTATALRNASHRAGRVRACTRDCVRGVRCTRMHWFIVTCLHSCRDFIHIPVAEGDLSSSSSSWWWKWLGVLVCGRGWGRRESQHALSRYCARRGCLLRGADAAGSGHPRVNMANGCK